jgi:U3 small nucleolar RNA-associated protein 3
MGKGRRKNTAKTGDKALYGQRSQPHQKSHPKSRYRGGGGDDGSDEDAMYDTVDRFHNRREKKQQEEFLRLDGNDYGGGDDGEESEGDNVEAVMDLGVGGSDDDGDDDDDDESSGSEGESAGGSTSSSASGDQTKEIDYDDDEEDDDSLEERDEEVEDVRDWGKRKSAYYHGDTADLEIGQEQDDAFLEEEAAKEIQRARMRELSEEDFALEDDGNGDVRGGSSAPAAPIGHPHRLSRREKGRLLDRQSPEFLPLVRHFADVARELHDRTDVAARALMEGEAGAAEVSWFSVAMFRAAMFA